MKKRKAVIGVLIGIVAVLTIVVGIAIVQKNKNEKQIALSKAQSVSVSESSAKASKWRSSVATAQSAANAKYRSVEAAKQSSTVAKEKSKKANEDNQINFSTLNAMDQAKAAIFYGIGNTEYFVNDGDYEISKNAYSKGVRVGKVNVITGYGSDSYVVVPADSPTAAGAPVFSYLELGIINSNGDRAMGITYGRVGDATGDGDEMAFDNDPNEATIGAGVSYEQLNNWINQHGGKAAIEKIIITEFQSTRD